MFQKAVHSFLNSLFLLLQYLQQGKNTVDISTLKAGFYIFRLKGRGYKILVN
jgi:hypothetical protein